MGQGDGEEKEWEVRSCHTLFLRQFLPQSCQLCPQLSSRDQPSLLPIDHGQRRQDLLLRLLLLHLPVHDVEEGGEVQLCIALWQKGEKSSALDSGLVLPLPTSPILPSWGSFWFLSDRGSTAGGSHSPRTAVLFCPARNSPSMCQVLGRTVTHSPLLLSHHLPTPQNQRFNHKIPPAVSC